MGGPTEAPSIPGISEGYHNLSHRGKDIRKIERLTRIISERLKAFASFLGRLRSAKEGDSNLLDRTMVLSGSHLGNASSHDNDN